MRRALSSFVLLLFLVAPALAGPPPTTGKAVFIASDELKDMGIRPRALRLSNVSRDGRVTLLTEKEHDARLKAKGQVWRLRVFTLPVGASTPKLSTIPVPTTNLEQVWLSPDGSQALIIADSGTRLIGVDIKKATTNVILSYEKGEAGFRVQPSLVWFEKGFFHTMGYFLDANGISQGDAVVAVNARGNGLVAIHKVRDITGLVKETKGSVVCLWHSSKQAYYAGKCAEKKIVMAAWYTEKGKPVPCDVAEAFGGIAAGDNRVIFASRDGKKYSLTVCDVMQAKKWQLGDGKTHYDYPYMSEDGRTVLATTFDLKKAVMSTFYGTEGDRCVLRPVPGLSKLPMGTIRFSADGQVISLYNEKGLAWYRLPSPRPVRK